MVTSSVLITFIIVLGVIILIIGGAHLLTRFGTWLVSTILRMIEDLVTLFVKVKYTDLQIEQQKKINTTEKKASEEKVSNIKTNEEIVIT